MSAARRAPVLALLAVTACGGGPAHRHAGTAEDPFVVGMSQCNLGEPWRVQMNADVRAAAAANPGLRVVFKDAQNNSLTQRAQVEEFVEEGVDLLIISPKEAQPLTEPVAKAVAAGILRVISERLIGVPTSSRPRAAKSSPA